MSKAFDWYAELYISMNTYKSKWKYIFRSKLRNALHANLLTWADREQQPWKWEASFLKVRNVTDVYINRFGWDKNQTITFCPLYHLALNFLECGQISYPPLTMIYNRHVIDLQSDIITFLSSFFCRCGQRMAFLWSRDIIFSIGWKFDF